MLEAPLRAWQPKVWSNFAAERGSRAAKLTDRDMRDLFRSVPGALKYALPATFPVDASPAAEIADVAARTTPMALTTRTAIGCRITAAQPPNP